MKCIYCKTDINNTNASIEHVFPQSFGCTDEWVLDCVCEPCNNNLGGTIDRWLATDSLEAVRRMQIYGSKSGNRVRLKRLYIHLPEEEKYKQFQGANIWLDYDKKNNIVVPAQVGLLNEQGKREFFTAEDLNLEGVVTIMKTLHLKDLRIIGPTQEAHDGMIELLKAKGVIKKYDKKEEGGLPEGVIIDNSKILIEGGSTIDRDVQRAIAKIAFNYLAKTQSGPYVMHERFDEIRKFINGEMNGPFFYDVKSGHAFDVHENQIVDMFSAPGRLLPKSFD